jgi:site-specific recombinase XerD
VMAERRRAKVQRALWEASLTGALVDLSNADEREVAAEFLVELLTTHAHAVEMAREGVPLNVIQRQLGHADLGVTSIYLQGIDNTEVISTIHARRAPTMPASAGLLM